MSHPNANKKKTALIIKAYPVALVFISLALNLAVFSIGSPAIALPSHDLLTLMAIACLVLLLNHTWLMTSTELTRLKYDIRATPEEWTASGISKDDVTETGFAELQRRHNSHRNATENTTLFVLLAIPFLLISPSAWAAGVWLIGFAIGRLGHTYGYLSGKTGARGFFMSVSLLSLYGLAGYIAIALIF